MKCVILIDESLPLGLIANSAEAIENRVHTGITTMPIPILKSDISQLKKLRDILFDDKYHECLVVDFTNVAQSTKTYEDYSNAISTTPLDQLEYLDIAIYSS